jgi:alpha-N-arabinofuranosidase
VFDLFKVHHDADHVPLRITSQDYAFGGEKLTAINASASRDKAGNINISIVNIDPNVAVDIQLDIPGLSARSIAASVITSAQFTDHNTFEKPETIKPEKFNGARKTRDTLSVKMPAKSIVLVTLSQ